MSAVNDRMISICDLEGAMYGRDANIVLPAIEAFYSQWGEDKWIVENLSLPEKGVVVEVGAGDATEFSNSRHFENRRWKTLLIEPDPRRQVGLAKRNAIIEQCAVSSSDGFADLHLHRDPNLSSLKSNDGDTVKVQTRRLQSILDAQQISNVDILSIDTEGTELDVWASVDLNKVRPSIVIVEWNTEGMASRKDEILRRFEGDGYVLKHTSAANFILVDGR